MTYLFFACTPDTYLPERDSSEEWSVFEAVQPKWDTEEILTSYEELLSYGIPNGHHVWLLYKELYDEGATPNCPGTEYNFNSVELTGYDYGTDGTGTLLIQSVGLNVGATVHNITHHHLRVTTSNLLPQGQIFVQLQVKVVLNVGAMIIITK